MHKLSVLIVDDHPLFREGLRTLLSSVPEMVIIGEAANGREAIEQATFLQPDIVLMDLQMPEVDGIEATQHIAATVPHARVIIVTMFEDTDAIFAAIRAGAYGNILKSSGQDDLFHVMRMVAEGEAIIGPEIARRIISYFPDAPASPSGTSGKDLAKLSDQERRILEMVAQGASVDTIADELSLSLRSVGEYIAGSLSKLHQLNGHSHI
ncbi:MAG: response regulator transcription factor [Chloroflexi bacterium]|nr:response regulator transcription factor [Chloroflexota bacterium]